MKDSINMKNLLSYLRAHSIECTQEGEKIRAVEFSYCAIRCATVEDVVYIEATTKAVRNFLNY